MSIHDEMFKMEQHKIKNNKKSISQEFIQFTKHQRDKEIVSSQIDAYEEYLRHKKDKEVDDIIKHLRSCNDLG